MVVFEDEPVEGADVHLIAQFFTDAGMVSEERVTTDAKGRFDFGPRLAAGFALAATYPGRTTARAWVDLRDPNLSQPSDQLLLVLRSCTKTVFGRVTSHDGRAIPVASIRPLEDWWTHRPGTTTDERGQYSLCMPNRFGMITVAAQGYGAVTAKVDIRDDKLRLDFSLSPTGVIRGRVVRSHDGEPVLDALVYASSDNDDVLAERQAASRVTFSDRNGEFRIAGLAPGQYNVFASMDVFRSPEPAEVVVVANAAAEVELSLDATATVSGIVTDGRRRVSGVRIHLSRDAPKFNSRPAVSQGDGSYVITGAPTGELVFRAREYDIDEPAHIYVDRSEIEGVEVRVAATATVSGVVVRNGEPVAGALVSVKQPNPNSEWVRSTTLRMRTLSRPDGSFELRHVVPGKHEVYAESEALGFLSASSPVEITGAEQVDGLVLDLSLGARISGVVVDQRGVPVQNAEVGFSFQSGGETRTSRTTTDGGFSVGMLSGGGDYDVEVLPAIGGEPFAPANGSAFQAVSVPDGTTHVDGLRLVVRFRRLRIAGMVVDGAGEPVGDVVVALASAYELPEGREEILLRLNPNLLRQSVRSDARGRFVFRNLREGSYVLQAGGDAAAPAHRVAAGTEDVRLVLRKTGGIEGTLAGFRERPSVHVLPEGGIEFVESRQAILTGHGFALTGLQAGVYIVSAKSSDQVAYARAEVRPGETAKVQLKAGGTGVIRGRVHLLGTETPVGEMNCHASPRAPGSLPIPPLNKPDEQVATGPDGRFELEFVPAGEVDVVCKGPDDISAGHVIATLDTGSPLELGVPVVRVAVSGYMGDPKTFGATFDESFRIEEVIKGSPAAKGGIQTGDVLVAIQGEPIARLGIESLFAFLYRRPAGTTIGLSLDRDGARVEVRVVTSAASDNK